MVRPTAAAYGLIARALDLLDPDDDDTEMVAMLLRDALDVLDDPAAK